MSQTYFGRKRLSHVALPDFMVVPCHLPLCALAGNLAVTLFFPSTAEPCSLLSLQTAHKSPQLATD